MKHLNVGITSLLLGMIWNYYNCFKRWYIMYDGVIGCSFLKNCLNFLKLTLLKSHIHNVQLKLEFINNLNCVHTSSWSLFYIYKNTYNNLALHRSHRVSIKHLRCTLFWANAFISYKCFHSPLASSKIRLRLPRGFQSCYFS